MYGKSMTMEEYRASPVMVWPYRLPDLSVTSDGAVACVVTTRDRARDLRKTPVSVLGIGCADAVGELWWAKQQYDRLPVARAKEMAFQQAGLELSDVDVLQLYDCFTGEVLFQLEDYGFCGKGEGGAFAHEGHLGPGGDLPCNTGGGLLSAYHLADLTGLAEAVHQLRCEAGARQVPNARVAMVTGNGGDLVSPGLSPLHSTLLLGTD
jgi:acetyl-CoA acetyltransferase